MILGVTGNIASGKSTIVKEFARRGAEVVDADQLARQVVELGSPVLAQLAAVFGTGMLHADGSLNRSRLGEMVFADDAARKQLNTIIHPAIAELAIARLGELSRRKDIPLIVYEAPLLFEAKAEDRVDKILVIKIAVAEQLRRLIERDGLSEVAARERMKAQMPQHEKLERADFVIDNSGSFEDTKIQVDALWQQLVGKKT